MLRPRRAMSISRQNSPHSASRSAARRAGSVVHVAPYRPCSTPTPLTLERGSERGPGLRCRGPLLHRLAEHLRIGRSEVRQLQGRVPGRRGRRDDERRLVVRPPVTEIRAQCFHRFVVVRRSAWASSAMITSHVWSLTFSSRSHVITTSTTPPSPNAVMVRHQWPIVIAAGRSATTSTRRAPRRSPPPSPQDRGDRLAHVGVVGQQELPSARRGVRRSHQPLRTGSSGARAHRSARGWASDARG